jgi:hypothetical protein
MTVLNNNVSWFNVVCVSGSSFRAAQEQPLCLRSIMTPERGENKNNGVPLHTVVDAQHLAKLKVLAGVALGDGDELVPFLLRAVGAADHDEAPVGEVEVLEDVLDVDGGAVEALGIAGKPVFYP